MNAVNPSRLAPRDDTDKTPKPEASGAMSEQLAYKSRFVLLFGEIDDESARRVCERMILLSQASSDPIKMVISSPGGHVESGDAIHDMIRFVGIPVWTIGSGWVASAGTHVFLAAPKERRVCLPNTRFMIHQPSGGAGGRASDIAIQAKEIIKMRERIARVIAKETGQTFERVMQDIDRDHWMSAKEAMDYGLVSRVVDKQSDLS